MRHSRSWLVIAAAIVWPGFSAAASDSAFRDCQDCPEMVVVPAGKFQMGPIPSDPWRAGEAGPAMVDVKIRSAFALGKYEITVGEFRAFVRATGYRTDAERNVEEKGCNTWEGRRGAARTWMQREGRDWEHVGFRQTESFPAGCISWNDAQAYVKWLAERTGRPYRLPTEVEWEYAARTGTTTSHYWGDDSNAACDFANVADRTRLPTEFVREERHECRDGYVFASPVGSFRPNAFGLFDMAGNVWEWVEDCADGDVPTGLRSFVMHVQAYFGVSHNISAASTAGCEDRISRGGAWFASTKFTDVNWQ